MDKRTRAGKIYAAGLAAAGVDIEEFSDVPEASDWEILVAIAAMIAEATKKPERKKKELLYNEHDVLRVLNYELAVTRHGSLNRQLGNMELRDDDLVLFEAWFRDVMYPWMQTKEDFAFTYSMLTRKYPEWLEKARQHSPASTATQTASWR